MSRHVPEGRAADYLSHCLAGRPGTMREVAEVVLFLADERSSYVNAQTIFVDGGL